MLNRVHKFTANVNFRLRSPHARAHKICRPCETGVIRDAQKSTGRRARIRRGRYNARAAGAGARPARQQRLRARSKPCKRGAALETRATHRASFIQMAIFVPGVEFDGHAISRLIIPCARSKGGNSFSYARASAIEYKKTYRVPL